MGSDHYPIFTNILGFRTAGRQFCNVTRWDTYREALEESTDVGEVVMLMREAPSTCVPGSPGTCVRTAKNIAATTDLLIEGVAEHAATPTTQRGHDEPAQ
ncbi:hypothetical protein HPB52_024484 [Rhipicephalus sanguineus]|uniref:Uncharacterized protein n=1 Tax=Rhipicephalus sanguineus TaxID=34632 RepID=A0A9D4TCD5_RHISA|nr:hypothetical protein HPB52_024484 [Rhipicephalus sanguineus]